MELKTLRPINDYKVKECTGREYDDELDDGRAVIADICEIFDDTKGVIFKVSGFGEENWAVDCRFDLPVIIEQLPEILGKINNSDFNFSLDFYEQGIERELEFLESTDFVSLKCISRNNWVPAPDRIEMKKEDICKIFKNLYRNFLSYSEVLCKDLANHILLKDWMEIK